MSSLPTAASHPTESGSERPFPSWLARYVVDQDVDRYTYVDHAVWRFVLLQMFDRLQHTAHPAYAAGLTASGISCERIPSVREMNEHLGRIGWGAVCVDGFIPPRAFQAFQAARVLPIAAEIRSPEHLPYTPAPDIIHEAAGHAPILADPTYAHYVSASGEVASRAFASAADNAVYAAIFALSALKEDPAHTALALEAAERELQHALDSVTELSEAAKLSRLYWWTAEYGLVGTPSNYKLYGAGLLSSLGESHSCHDPRVRKLSLDRDCVFVDYDITRAQPQLFVARDFEQLHAVLEEIDATLAYRIGGVYAIRVALAAREQCTVRFAGDYEVVGTLSDALTDAEQVQAVVFEPHASFTRRGVHHVTAETASFIPLGSLRDGCGAAYLATGEWRRYRRGGRLRLEFASGLRLSGDVRQSPTRDPSAAVWLESLRVERGDELLFDAPGRMVPLFFSNGIITAEAGSRNHDAIDQAAVPPRNGHPARPRVPKLRSRSAAATRLNQLYREVHELRWLPPHQLGVAAERLHGRLTGDLSTEWLLRWNLLDCLEQARQQGTTTEALWNELDALELHYQRRHPIAMGLRYLEAEKA